MKNESHHGSGARSKTAESTALVAARPRPTAAAALLVATVLSIPCLALILIQAVF